MHTEQQQQRKRVSFGQSDENVFFRSKKRISTKISACICLAYIIFQSFVDHFLVSRVFWRTLSHSVKKLEFGVCWCLSTFLRFVLALDNVFLSVNDKFMQYEGWNAKAIFSSFLLAIFFDPGLFFFFNWNLWPILEAENHCSSVWEKASVDPGVSAYNSITQNT